MQQRPARIPSHPASELFPLLDPEKLSELAEDMREHGQREPIVLLEGQILDGRNRWHACELAGIEPCLRSVSLADIGGSPVDYVISANLKRRHLTPVQIAAVAAAALPLFAEEAKARQVAGGKAAGRGRPIGSVHSARNLSDGEARTAAAKATGAGQRATAIMSSVAEKAPDVLAAVLDGTVQTVADAARLIKLAPGKRAEAIGRAKAGDTRAIADAARQGAKPKGARKGKARDAAEDELVAAQAEAAESAALRDKLNRLLPGDIAESFATVDVLYDALDRAYNIAIRCLGEIAALPRETWYGANGATRLLQDLQVARLGARQQAPHTMCPYCKLLPPLRSLCDVCHGIGFVGRRAFDAAAEELKIGGKQAVVRVAGGYMRVSDVVAGRS